MKSDVVKKGGAGNIPLFYPPQQLSGAYREETCRIPQLTNSTWRKHTQEQGCFSGPRFVLSQNAKSFIPVFAALHNRAAAAGLAANPCSQ